MYIGMRDKNESDAKIQQSNFSIILSVQAYKALDNIFNK